MWRLHVAERRENSSRPLLAKNVCVSYLLTPNNFFSYLTLLPLPQKSSLVNCQLTISRSLSKSSKISLIVMHNFDAHVLSMNFSDEKLGQKLCAAKRA